MDIPHEFQDAAESAHESLVENVASEDDELLEKYLEGVEISNQELIECNTKCDTQWQFHTHTLW